jgi:ABC-2 type transport system permease protein
MSALATHFGLEFRSTLRSPGLVLLVYLFPIAFYLLMGLVMLPLNPPFGDVFIPAMTLFAVMTPMLLGLPGPIVDSREAGIFRGYRINGIPTAALLGIPAATLAVHSIITAGLVGLSAGPLFDVAIPQQAMAMTVVVLLALFVFTGFGLLFGVVSPDSRMTVIWSQAIFLPSMLIGGLMIGFDLLPAGMRPISMLLPTTHLMQLAESWAYGRDVIIPPVVAVVALLVSGLTTFGLTAWGFSWEPGGRDRKLHPALALLPLVPLGLTALLV